jgi:hypothetical protein
MSIFRSQGGSHVGSEAVSRSTTHDRSHEPHQDHQGPLDGELLDLYIAILIAVPLGCFLRSVWS